MLKVKVVFFTSCLKDPSNAPHCRNICLAAQKLKLLMQTKGYSEKNARTVPVVHSACGGGSPLSLSVGLLCIVIMINVACSGLLLLLVVQGILAQENCECYKNSSQPMNHTIQDLKADLSSPTLDILFLIDISGSITTDEFKDILKFLQELFFFAAVSSKLYIHPDYARVQVIQFNHQADKIFETENSPLITGCEFHDIITGLNRSSTWGGTRMSTGLSVAKDAFYQGAMNRPVAKQILFVLTDGEFQDDINEIKLQLDRLKSQNVNIYSVGLGHYQSRSTSQACQNLKEVASLEAYYGCVDDWYWGLNPGYVGYQLGRYSSDSFQVKSFSSPSSTDYIIYFLCGVCRR